MATTLKKVIQSAPRMRGSLPKKAQTGAVVDKTSTGPKRNVAKDIKAERTAVANKNKAVTNALNKVAKDYKKEGEVYKRTSTDFKYEHELGDPTMGRTYERSQELSKFANKKAKTKDSLSTVYSKRAEQSIKNPKYKPALKNGGSVKAKDGKWMQKAAASIKKRGTAGKCTPITKPGCTGKAKALAKTFKAIAKKNKK
jgi:hypothetical protein